MTVYHYEFNSFVACDDSESGVELRLSHVPKYLKTRKLILLEVHKNEMVLVFKTV